MGRDALPIFADIDSMDADRFLAHLTEDVSFRFGNGEPVHGHDEVRAAVDGFWSTIGGLEHHVVAVWDVDEDRTVAHIDVEYTRKDGTTVTVPNVDLLRWRGDRVEEWQIVIDLAPLFA